MRAKDWGSFTLIFITSLAIGWIGSQLPRDGEWALALTVSLVSALGMVWDDHTSHDIDRVGFRRERTATERL
jgi:hypothetical protein